MTSIKFLKGLRQIGGTFVTVETGRAVCMFDFGFAVGAGNDSSIRLRPGHIPQDCVRNGLLPAVHGIYEPGAARELGLLPFGSTEKPCFFVISHMHIDHMGGLDMLDPQVPVYMSQDSLTLYRRLAAQGELTYRAHANCIPMGSGETVCVEDIRVTAIPIDHDCTGACGFLIQTPDGTICYTGDYRFHGWHPERTQAFAGRCRGADVLITEGVTVSWGDVDMLALTEPGSEGPTEYTLLEQTASLCRSAEGLVVFNPYARNVERVHRLLTRLAPAHRTLVLDAAQADYLRAFYRDGPLHVYAETVRGRPVPPNAILVGRKALLDAPGRYVLQLEYADLNELLDLAPVTSAYLHMDGAPLGSYGPSYEKLLLRLDALWIPYHGLGLGGHARPWFLRKLIDTIAPRVLVPLHSQRPEQVASAKAGRRLLPEEGEVLTLDGGNIV